MKQFIMLGLLSLCSLCYMAPVAAVPPYIGIDTAEALNFGDSTCVEVAKKILTDEGFAEVQQYEGGSTVFAAYRNQANYQYKAAVRCLADQNMVTVVVVANAPGKALKKAKNLLALIQAQAGGKQIQKAQSKAEVPPFIGIDMAELNFDDAFGDASCVEVVGVILTNAGFAKIQEYEGETTVFAAYRNQVNYQYKVAIRCLPDHNMVTVIVVANAPGKALKKAKDLLALIKQQQTIDYEDYLQQLTEEKRQGANPQRAPGQQSAAEAE